MSVGSRDFLLDAFDSNWVAPLGPHVDGFERELAAFVDSPAAAALSSGTAALHLALLISGVGPGDEVIVPTLTFSAPANAVTYTGASLRFVDVEPDTWNLSPDLLEVAFDAGPLPAAVIAVDLYGQCAQLDAIADVCAARSVTLIEDAAEALGANWRGRAAGTFGRLGAFSFNGNKIMTTSGGGMLVGNEDDIARARYLSTQARQPELHYEHTEIGFNYRMSNLLAAIGRAELADLPRKIDRRHEINARYRALLGAVDGLSFMPWDERGRPNGWLTVVLLDPERVGVSPAELCRHLDARDIEARPAWKPMQLQPVFRDVPTVGGELSRRLFERGVCLPSGSSMTDDDVERVVAAILECCGAG